MEDNVRVILDIVQTTACPRWMIKELGIMLMATTFMCFIGWSICEEMNQIWQKKERKEDKKRRRQTANWNC